MTDHEGNRKIYLAQGIREGLETVDYYCPRRSRANIKAKQRPLYPKMYDLTLQNQELNLFCKNISK